MRNLATFLFSISIAFFLILLSPSNSSCEKAEIKDVIVTNTAEDLLVYFYVEGCFTKKMEEAILNGIPTTFTFLIDLTHPSRFWFDETLVSKALKRTIAYDNLKKEFKVSFNSENEEALVFQDFLEAKKVTAEFDGTPIIPMSSIKRNNTYYLKIKAELDPIKLPFFLDYVLFFVSLWDFETEWHIESFKY